MNWFRWGWRRWVLLRVAGWLPSDSRAETALLDFLYPDDMIIKFD